LKNNTTSQEIRTLQTQYRPEIDGLRTIAVVSVLIYHAQFILGGITLLPGGFLGVDVFFVISGYLISLILLKEIKAGNFSFSSFYERRARRILPVLFLVMLACSALAWHTMLPKALVEYANSQLSSLLFSSNFWFWLEDSYTAESSELKPLLHTWSLSLEEQFYVFFPILLIILIGWMKRTNKQLITFLIVFFLVSLGLAQYASSRYIDANFYLPATRSWELLAGAIIAANEHAKGRQQIAINLRWIAPTLAMLLILAPMAIYHDDWQHPSFLTLAPVLGTALLIWSTPRDSLCYKILASKPFTSIGLVSYSLYLWHFPALAFAKIIKVEALSSSEKILCLVASLALAALGYFLVEQPARNRKTLSSRIFFSLLGFCSAILVGFSAYVIVSNGSPQRLGSIETLFEGARQGDSYLLQNGRRCDLRAISLEESCFFAFSSDGSVGGSGSSKQRAIINLGDSHADVLGNSLLQLAKTNGWDYRHLTLPGCPYVESSFRFKTGPIKNRCDAQQMDNFKAVLAASAPSIIVYTARLPGYISGEPFDNQEGGKETQASNRMLRVDPQGSDPTKTLKELIHQTFDNLIAMGHIVVVVYPIPEVGWDVPKIIKKTLDKIPDVPIKAKRKAFENLQISTSYSVYKQRSAVTKGILDSATAHPSLVRVRPDQIFCSTTTDRCYTHNDSVLYYYDNNHLSQPGAKMLVQRIAEQVALAIDTPLIDTQTN
jgi:peptidoglycan/LPS O-acetylase OafA/YrhL